ncbi:MAG: heavy-metal-associated domain-containing protein, partial [Microbacteriaceae bacterium]|nr:heavy-metal-associated domain-containing protein [Microbacteriaceae bacterium]
MAIRTLVLEVSGVHWASSKAVIESTLLRRPGVMSVEANPVSQTANVSFDPEVTSQSELRAWITECGYHCAGQSVPQHICDPSDEVGHTPGDATHDARTGQASGPELAPHTEHATPAGSPTPARDSQEVMGHGGGHGGM